MTQNESTQAVAVLAQSILRMNFPDGLPGTDFQKSEDYIQRFVSMEMPNYNTEKLTTENLVFLFEKYCEFDRVREELQ